MKNKETVRTGRIISHFSPRITLTYWKNDAPCSIPLIQLGEARLIRIKDTLTEIWTPDEVIMVSESIEKITELCDTAAQEYIERNKPTKNHDINLGE